MLWTTAAAAAKSLQSCPTLCDPRDGSPPGSPVPRILQARTLEWVAILKEISPKYSLEGLMLRPKLQYFGHLMRRTDSLEKTLMLGKIESGRRRGHRGWDGWMASPTQWTWVWVNSGSWWWTGRPGMLQSMRLQRVRHIWATELSCTETPIVGRKLPQ